MHKTEGQRALAGQDFGEDKAMKNTYLLRYEFALRVYNTAITREDFEKHFNRTREKVRFTFGGWPIRSCAY